MREPENWETGWKRFLYEGMSTVAIDASKLSKVFDFFHVSEHKLSKEDFFVFSPRRPRYPFSDFDGNITEDDYTKRISVAPTVDDALDALGKGALSHVYGWGHLYAGFGSPDTEPRTKGCPNDGEHEYGEEFRMSKWLKKKLLDRELDIKDAKELGMQIPPGLWPPGYEEKEYHPNTVPTDIRPSTLPGDLKDDFEHCVPDAGETDEKWLLKPTRLIYLGEVEAETGDVLLSAAGLWAVKEAGLKPHSY